MTLGETMVKKVLRNATNYFTQKRGQKWPPQSQWNGMDVTKKGYKLLMLVFERDTIIYSVTAAAAVATLAMLVKNLSHDK